MLRTLANSLIARLIVLLGIFAAVPLILYEQFRAADEARQALLLDSVREKGIVISRAMAPILARAETIPYFRLGEELARITTESVSLKLLFRPADVQGAQGFFYVASTPPVETAALEIERQRLADAGVLARLTDSCEGDLPLAMRIEQPTGRAELLTSITPVQTAKGCWAIVTSSTLDSPRDRRLGQPYWRLPEVQMAGLVYLLLAVAVFGIFIALWRNLIRFGRIARAIRPSSETRFAARNTIPELSEVARSFDRMVETLRASADNIRQAAEDTAHSFKTPIGIIRQSLEPVRRRLNPTDKRANEAVAAIDAALGKLDGLVATARQLDQAQADLLDPPREPVDLSALCRSLAEGYARGLPPSGPRMTAEIAEPITVLGSAELIETVIENLIDNALSFSPAAGAVRLSLSRRGRQAILLVEDEGPGVPPDRLEKIFERYYSYRPKKPPVSDDEAGEQANFGIGLWIARRNIEALGGSVIASNRPSGGLRMTVELPCR